MNFNLDLVLAELADWGPTARYRHDSRLDLDRVEVLGPSSIPRTGSLFVVDAASFGTLDDAFAAAGSFLVLGADAPPEEADKADAPPVLYVPAGPGLPGPAEMLARLLEMRLRLDAWSETLLTAMARDAPLQEVFDIAAEQFANPLMLSDATLYFVLVAGRLPEELDDRLWTSAIATGACPIELCMEAWAAGSSDPGAQDRAFLMENATGDGRSYLVRNLMCGEAYYGCFELVDVNAPFQPADFALVDYLGNLLTLVMPHQGRPQPAEEPLGPLRDLLDGRPVRPQVLEYALSKAGWRADDHFFVARFGTAEPAEDAGARGQTVRLIAEVYPRARFFDDGDAALMVARDADYPLAALHARHAARDVEAGVEPRFRAGFSSLFADFSLVRTAADQAALACGLVDDTRMGGAFGSTLSCFYDDCWFEDMRVRLALDTDASWLLDHATVALARADAEDGAAYVETALTYLGNGCNATRTAEALFIHRNTLAYRLKRIKALSGIDLESPAAAGTDLLRVHLSCRLLAQARR